MGAAQRVIAGTVVMAFVRVLWMRSYRFISPYPFSRIPIIRSTLLIAAGALLSAGSTLIIKKSSFAPIFLLGIGLTAVGTIAAVNSAQLPTYQERYGERGPDVLGIYLRTVSFPS